MIPSSLNTAFDEEFLFISSRPGLSRKKLGIGEAPSGMADEGADLSKSLAMTRERGRTMQGNERQVKDYPLR